MTTRRNEQTLIRFRRVSTLTGHAFTGRLYSNAIQIDRYIKSASSMPLTHPLVPIEARNDGRSSRVKRESKPTLDRWLGLWASHFYFKFTLMNILRNTFKRGELPHHRRVKLWTRDSQVAIRRQNFELIRPSGTINCSIASTETSITHETTRLTPACPVGLRL